jgi:peptidoglycan/xylan/chitin deacetylase (PgdA/CDA1 family)
MPRELILNFHGLGEPPDTIAAAERNVWVPVQWLAAILDAAPRDGVGVTFDDGNVSDTREALPALIERGLTGRFFPLTGRIGTAGYLGDAEIAQLSSAGMTIGSHGLDHRDWRTLSDAELQDELTVSRRKLGEIVGGEIDEAACPFGSYDRRVLRALRDAGYRQVFTSDGGSHASGAWLASRTTVNRGRPLQYWLDLASAGAGKPLGLLQRGKRILKRVR